MLPSAQFGPSTVRWRRMPIRQKLLTGACSSSPPHDPAAPAGGLERFNRGDEPTKPALDALQTKNRFSPEERDITYLSALYDGDARCANVIARAPIPKEWPKEVRVLWLDRRGLSGIAVRVGG